ncbi:MAG TPA: hypothetical protein VF331_19005 [Polyangiales bacterium]
MLAAAWFWSASGVRAQAECKVDADCGKGFTCQTFNDTACPDIACAPGEACPKPTCTTTEVKRCQLGPCATDTDCGADMVCYETTSQKCPTAPACSKDVCPAVDAGACTQTSVKTCTLRYTLPCSVDTDCGAHFSCVAGQECVCSGSSGSAGGSVTPLLPALLDGGKPQLVDAAVAPVDAAVSCDCKPTDTKHCKVDKITCTTANDCPTGWTCVPEATTSSAGCAVPQGVDASACRIEPQDAAVGPSACVPPYARAPGATKSATEASLGTGGSAPTNQTANAGHDAADGGAAGTGASSGGSKHSGGLCSVSRVGQSTGSHSTSALWLLLAFFMVTARRRGCPRKA